MPVVRIYIVEWHDAAGQPLGHDDYGFLPGEGRVRHSTVGTPGAGPLPGYPHTCHDRGWVNVAVPDGWELDDPDLPTWLVNTRGEWPARLAAADVYLRAARSADGFALTGPPVTAN